jgi:D-lactate dehydrogenase
MNVAVFSAKPYDRRALTRANAEAGHVLSFFKANLNRETLATARGFEAVCIFVNDLLVREDLTVLRDNGIRLIALRCAGFNNVDVRAARELGLQVVSVPAYSPHAVAEHTLALILALNRGVHRSFNRVREANFELEGLLGFDLFGKRAGIIGTGKIGALTARILKCGFQCDVVVSDPHPSREVAALGIPYVERGELIATSDIISLHCPLTRETHHLIDRFAVDRMKQGVMLINTSRGGLIDTPAVVQGLKTGKIGYLGLDVYENESGLFFNDHSHYAIPDDVLARLLTFPNVLITGHQAFFTEEALSNIAATTIANLSEFEKTGNCANAVKA